METIKVNFMKVHEDIVGKDRETGDETKREAACDRLRRTYIVQRARIGKSCNRLQFAKYAYTLGYVVVISV